MAKVPYGVPRHCTILQDGKLVRVDYLENDHCCERFALADRWLKEKSLQKEGPVGHAFARLIRSRDIVATALGQLGRDPLIFLHPPEAGCRSEEHTSELQSRFDLVCRLLLEKKNIQNTVITLITKS